MTKTLTAQGIEDGDLPRAIGHGALRGAIAAMSMTGVRTVTVNAGVVEEAPPQAIFRQKIHRLGLSSRRRRRKRVIEELAHWGYGAGGGAAFAMLPGIVRQRGWAGPVYGLLIWFCFEAGIGPDDGPIAGSGAPFGRPGGARGGPSALRIRPLRDAARIGQNRLRVASRRDTAPFGPDHAAAVNQRRWGNRLGATNHGPLRLRERGALDPSPRGRGASCRVRGSVSQHRAERSTLWNR